jgi:hypothetical protein
MQFESSSSEEEIADDDVDLQVWNEIESESDAEFQEDYGIVEEVTSASEDNTKSIPLMVIDISSLTKLLVSWFAKQIDIRRTTLTNSEA